MARRLTASVRAGAAGSGGGRWLRGPCGPSAPWGGGRRLAPTAPVRWAVVPDTPVRTAAGVLAGWRVCERSAHLACRASPTAPRRSQGLSPPNTPRPCEWCAWTLTPASSAICGVVPPRAPPHARVEEGTAPGVCGSPPRPVLPCTGVRRRPRRGRRTVPWRRSTAQAVAGGGGSWV